VLVEIGRGKLAPEDLSGYLADPSASAAKWTAPPSGLFLEHIRYDGEERPGEPRPAFFPRS
jgi:tRNA pseudouridine38-40 synthase